MRSLRDGRTAVRAALAWAVIGLTVAAFGVVVVQGVRTSVAEQKAATIASWTSSYRLEVCIRSQLKSHIPEHSKIIIRDTNAYDAQLLAELITPLAVPEISSDEATYAISLVPGVACKGKSLQVKRL